MHPRIELADDRKSGNARGRPGFHRSGRRGGPKLREIAEGFQRLLSGDVSWRDKERNYSPHLDTKTFQEAAAQLCSVFDRFLLWAMGV